MKPYLAGVSVTAFLLFLCWLAGVDPERGMVTAYCVFASAAFGVMAGYAAKLGMVQ